MRFLMKNSSIITVASQCVPLKLNASEIQNKNVIVHSRYFIVHYSKKPMPVTSIVFAVHVDLKLAIWRIRIPQFLNELCEIFLPGRQPNHLNCLEYRLSQASPCQRLLSRCFSTLRFSPLSKAFRSCLSVCVVRNPWKCLPRCFCELNGKNYNQSHRH